MQHSLCSNSILLCQLGLCLTVLCVWSLHVLIWLPICSRPFVPVCITVSSICSRIVVLIVALCLQACTGTAPLRTTALFACRRDCLCCGMLQAEIPELCTRVEWFLSASIRHHEAVRDCLQQTSHTCRPWRVVLLDAAVLSFKTAIRCCWEAHPGAAALCCRVLCYW